MARKLLTEAGSFTVNHTQIKNVTELTAKNLTESKSAYGLMQIDLPVTVLNQKNANQRIYSESIMSNALNKAKDWLATRGAYGSVDEHPEQEYCTPGIASHIVTDAWIEHNDGVCQLWNRWEILNTDRGKNLKALVEAKTALPISIRGMGSESAYGDILDDYEFISTDCVAIPSANLRVQAREVLESKAIIKPITESKTMTTKFKNYEEFRASMKESAIDLKNMNHFNKFKKATMIENSIMESDMSKEDFGKCYKLWEDVKQKIFEADEYVMVNHDKNSELMNDEGKVKQTYSYDKDGKIMSMEGHILQSLDNPAKDPRIVVKEDEFVAVSDDGSTTTSNSVEDALQKGSTVIAKKANGDEEVVTTAMQENSPVNKLVQSLIAKNLRLEKLVKEADYGMDVKDNALLKQQDELPDMKLTVNNAKETTMKAERIITVLEQRSAKKVLKKEAASYKHAYLTALREAAAYRQTALLLASKLLEEDAEERGEVEYKDLDSSLMDEESVDAGHERADWMKTGAIVKESRTIARKSMNESKQDSTDAPFVLNQSNVTSSNANREVDVLGFN